MLGAVAAGAVACNYLGVDGAAARRAAAHGRARRRPSPRRALHDRRAPDRERDRPVARSGASRSTTRPRAPVLRLTKGVHIVVPRERVGNVHAIVAPRAARRPRDVRDSVGRSGARRHDRHRLRRTTRGTVAADADDVRYLLEARERLLPGRAPRRRRRDRRLRRAPPAGGAGRRRAARRRRRARRRSSRARRVCSRSAAASSRPIGASPSASSIGWSSGCAPHDPERRFGAVPTAAVPLPGARRRRSPSAARSVASRNACARARRRRSTRRWSRTW